jgi:branched-chain amino acid transport system substrate-binding protein
MRSLTLRLVTLFASALLFCGPAAADILVGIAGPLSGPNAAFGNELRVGATAAITAVNASGGINGENLSLVEGDDGCDVRRAGDVAKDFINKDVRLVVGHFCSAASMAAATEYLAKGVLMITPSATHPELTSKGLWNVFRLTAREDMQADVAAQRIKSRGEGGEAILLTDGLPETAALVKRFKAALPNAKSITVKSGDPRLPQDTSLLTATAAYLALQFADAAAVTRALRDINLGLPIYGPDYLQSEAFGTRASAAANGTHVSFLQELSSIADPRRTATMLNAEGSTLAAYAAVEVFVAAAKSKTVNDTRGMANWLSGGNQVNTIIGNIRFMPTGDLQQQPYVWYQWKDGNLVPESP